MKKLAQILREEGLLPKRAARSSDAEVERVEEILHQKRRRPTWLMRRPGQPAVLSVLFRGQERFSPSTGAKRYEKLVGIRPEWNRSAYYWPTLVKPDGWDDKF